MKLTSAISSPNFYYYGANESQRRTTGSQIHCVPPAPTPDSGDEAAGHPELFCGVILALSSVSTVLLCLWQLSAA